MEIYELVEQVLDAQSKAILAIIKSHDVAIKYPIRVGELVKRTRRDMGLNMDEFSKLFENGTDKASLTRWECSVYSLSPTNLKRFSEISGIPLDDLKQLQEIEKSH